MKCNCYGCRVLDARKEWEEAEKYLQQSESMALAEMAEDEAFRQQEGYSYE